MAEKIQVSRIQNRRGLRKDLPQPLNAGEFGYCLDTGQLFIGSLGSHVENIVLGSELFQPVVQDGVIIANQLKNRVFFCDTLPFVKDEVSPDDIIVALENNIYKDCVLVDGTDYRDADLGDRDFSSTLQYQVLEDDKETGMITWRFQIGVYVTEVNEGSAIDIGIVFANIVQATIKNEIGEDTPIFNSELYNIKTINEDYDDETLTLTYATFNNKRLTFDEYSALSWCINQIYILEDESMTGLVTVIGNVEVVTEISLSELLPQDFRDTFEMESIDLGNNGDGDVPNLELSLGLENIGDTPYRSFDLDYSLVYRTNINGEYDRYSATGNMRIVVNYNDTTPSLSFTDTFTETTPPSGEFSWIPYISNNVVKFNYNNTVNDNTEVVDQNNNTIYPYSGYPLRLKVYSVQWANF